MKNLTIKDVYEKLDQYYQLDSWWPANSTFEVMIGAISGQNTN